MSKNYFDNYCPHFNIGTCNNSSDSKCKFTKHIKCHKNWLCDNADCPYGHGFDIGKRHIVIDIVNIRNNKEKCDLSPNKCKHPLGCNMPNCKFDHYLSLSEIGFLYNKIISHNVSYEKAYDNYMKKYYKNTISPKSDVASVTTTVPAMSPCIPCPVATVPDISDKQLYSDLLKDGKDSKDGKDDIEETAEKILSVRKELKQNEKHAEDIKNQIKKLDDSLKICLDKIENDKDKIRKLAIEIAEC